MIDWYKKVMIKNYANFSGRARRSEYWYFVLMNVVVIVFLVILYLCMLTVSETLGGVFLGALLLYFLIIIIPSLAVIVRRLHDINKSGWYYFVRFIPVAGPIWLLILLCTDGTAGNNGYGKDPKQEFDEINEIGMESLD
ncbi:DUF805 domain-containing protein [Flavobacterium sp.]|uniref:DUF805 domain-containing protein n=1 Tax=Flavobacterium sp. TaxID=239 RepID=UPI003D6A16B5